MNRSRITVPLAIVLALLAGSALTACSVQNIVHNVTGGSVDIPGKSVPKDFPSEVPLAKGEVLLGAAVGSKDGKVWTSQSRSRERHPSTRSRSSCWLPASRRIARSVGAQPMAGRRPSRMAPTAYSSS
jgi:hypothetical protein